GRPGGVRRAARVPPVQRARGQRQGEPDARGPVLPRPPLRRAGLWHGAQVPGRHCGAAVYAPGRAAQGPGAGRGQHGGAGGRHAGHHELARRGRGGRRGGGAAVAERRREHGPRAVAQRAGPDAPERRAGPARRRARDGAVQAGGREAAPGRPGQLRAGRHGPQARRGHGQPQGCGRERPHSGPLLRRRLPRDGDGRRRRRGVVPHGRGVVPLCRREGRLAPLAHPRGGGRGCAGRRRGGDAALHAGGRDGLRRRPAERRAAAGAAGSRRAVPRRRRLRAPGAGVLDARRQPERGRRAHQAGRRVLLRPRRAPQLRAGCGRLRAGGADRGERPGHVEPGLDVRARHWRGAGLPPGQALLRPEPRCQRRRPPGCACVAGQAVSSLLVGLGEWPRCRRGPAVFCPAPRVA
ncbi:hypothetical protein GGI08_009289, partial [Coemansia sp. S2]